MLIRLLDAGARPGPGLRCALVGGGPLAADLADRALSAGWPLAHTYGLTEACSQVTTSDIGAPGTAGQPLPGTRVEVAPDGEILVAGPARRAGLPGIRRLAAHRRPGPAGRSRAPDRDRPRCGHDRHGRRERGPGRGGSGAGNASGRDRSCRLRASRPRVGRGGVRRGGGDSTSRRPPPSSCARTAPSGWRGSRSPRRSG